MHKKSIDKMRPENLMSEMNLLWKKSGQKFYADYKDNFISIDCPACGHEEGIEFFKKWRFTHKICGVCKTIFVSPRPEEKLLETYYNNYQAPKYWNQILVNTDSYRKKIQYKPRARKILSAIKANTSRKPELAVDLGAGSGAFSLSLKDLEYWDRVLSLDLSVECVEKCKSAGLDAKVGSVYSLSPASIDYLAMNDLIEHLSNPEEFLCSCNKVLKPRGFLSIACPNGQGFDFKIMKDKAVNIHPPEHLQYFNPESMKVILNKTGFDIIMLETPGILDVQIVEREVKNKSFKIKNNDFIKYLLEECDDCIKDDFQKFLSVNYLSSHMLVVAQKMQSIN